ncbi:MAG: transposase, partial [bacterium]|nr:transposase [bacterium]
MPTPSLDNLDSEALRAIALDAWRRAEREERRAQVAEQHADEQRQHADEQRQHADEQRQHADQQRQRADEACAKAEALDTQVTVLLRRITELTRKLAAATDRDAQQELELELRRVREQLAAANNDRFGSTSERRDRTDKGNKNKGDKDKKKQRGHGPTPQPNLPIEEVIHPLDEADCTCPKCAADLRVMAHQFEETELISVVQTRYVLTKHKQQKYRCGGCGHIEAALGPKRFIPGGRYDLSFAVQVALDKYLYHLPLERQVRRMGRRGLQVTSQTLWDQLFALYLLLLPTFIALQARVRTSELLHAD